MLRIDEVIDLGRIILRECTIKNVLSLSLVIDTGIITPSIRSEQERSNIIQLSVRCRSLRITRAVCLAAPCEIAFIRAVGVLHVLLAPAEELIKYVLSVHLDSYHHSV